MEYGCAYCHKSGAQNTCGRCELVYYCDEDCQRNDWPNHKQSCGEETYNSIIPTPSKRPTFDDDSDSKLIIDRRKKTYIVENQFRRNNYNEKFNAIIQRNANLLRGLNIRPSPIGLLELGAFVGELINPETGQLFKSLELFALSNEWRIYQMRYEEEEDDDDGWEIYLERQRRFVKENKNV